MLNSRRKYRGGACLTLSLLLPWGAAGAQGALPRWSFELRGGELLNATGDAGALLRKDGAPGNLLTLVRHQRATSIRGAFEAAPGLELSLEAATGGLEVATEDLVGNPGVRPFASGQLRMGRLGLWINDGLFGSGTPPLFAPRSSRRLRWSVGLLAGRLEASGLSLVGPGSAFAGIDAVLPSPQTMVGFGARAEIRLGSSNWALGVESTMGWATGRLLEVRTRSDSPYRGTEIKYGPAQFLFGLGYHF